MGLSQRSRWTNTFAFKQCPSPPSRIFLILIKSYWCHKNVVLSVITPPTFFMSLLVGALHGKLGHALWWEKRIVSSLTRNYRFCKKNASSVTLVRKTLYWQSISISNRMTLGTLTAFLSGSVYVEWHVHCVRKESKDVTGSGLDLDVRRLAWQNEICISTK